jgi:putative two-component system response regulator
MEAHTVIGGRILSNGDSALIRTSEEIALSHHEKWNGKGYPRGLAGEAIPLRGRICAIADVFDALTSVRVYKPAFPVEKALDIIRKDTGAHFDPQVTEAFLKRLDEVVEIHRKYRENPDERPAPEWETAAAPSAAPAAPAAPAAQGGGR